jgi:hypothetical protein
MGLTPHGAAGAAAAADTAALAVLGISGGGGREEAASTSTHIEKKLHTIYVKADPTLPAWPVVEDEYSTLRERLCSAATEAPRYKTAWFHHTAAACPFG